ncbi:hypothetical protein IMZ48_18335 [Candidatus Bathyarchaeota archaeon]|nr:hypothetical protein [Candidatus Bathyarchaeota archaeon]
MGDVRASRGSLNLRVPATGLPYSNTPGVAYGLRPHNSTSCLSKQVILCNSRPARPSKYSVKT